MEIFLWSLSLFHYYYCFLLHSLVSSDFVLLSLLAVYCFETNDRFDCSVLLQLFRCWLDINSVCLYLTAFPYLFRFHHFLLLFVRLSVQIRRLWPHNKRLMYRFARIWGIILCFVSIFKFFSFGIIGCSEHGWILIAVLQLSTQKFECHQRLSLNLNWSARNEYDAMF